ncbi:hypothetical protein Fot_14600 [Forsythia ovata]|uniref:Uncharacterized protein n=1 Tax=Forsythia ovata TaxID=205694 RepID=A0ABD1W6R4_9LAMI
MSDEDGNTCTRQIEEHLDEDDGRVPEVAQPHRRGRRSRARMARNIEIVAEQMQEIQKQQVAQTAALNAYLQHRVMPPVPPVYPPYQPQEYEYQYREEEEDPNSYTSLERLVALYRGNDERDPTQYPYHGYNAEENYVDSRFPPEYSKEIETSQGSSVFYQLGSRPPRNMRERRAAATAAVAQAPHMFKPYQYQDPA